MHICLRHEYAGNVLPIEGQGEETQTLVSVASAKNVRENRAGTVACFHGGKAEYGYAIERGEASKTYELSWKGQVGMTGDSHISGKKSPI